MGVKKIFLFVVVSLSFINEKVFSQDLVLQQNFGWASETVGGKNGRIIKVTNLNESGQGSLREALAAKGKRIIVFEVGGTIDLKGNLIKIGQPYLSILGQTAPSPGITVINGEISVRTHDVVIQHLKIRPGASYKKYNFDGLSTIGKAYNVIIDHCSFTWAVDENLSASGARFDGSTPDEWRKNTSHRITFSNNIIGEALLHSIHIKGGHSMGTLIHDNVTDILLMRNLYVSNYDRNPTFKGGSRGVFLNNYIFNPGIRAMRYVLSEKEWENQPKQVGYLSVVGNILQLGRDSDKDIHFIQVDNGPLKLHLSDNIVTNLEGKRLGNLYKGNNKHLVRERPIWHNGLVVLKSKDLTSYLFTNVGARPWDRDDIDKRLVQGAFKNVGKIISSETEVGGVKSSKPTYHKFDEKQWDLNSLKKK